MQRPHEIPYAQLAQLGEPAGEPLEIEPPPLRQYAGSMALLALAAAAFAWAGWTFFRGESEEMAIGSAVLGLGLAAAAAFFLWRRENRRATLTLFGQGVTCSRRGRTRAFPYPEILSLSLRENEKLNNGVSVGLRRRLRLRSAGDRFALTHVAPHGQPDLFGSWLDAAIGGFASAAERGLAGGRPLSGKGWTLTPTGLRAASREVPFAELGAVGLVQRKVAVWRGDDELPYFETVAGSPNALVLARLLSRRIDEQPARPEESAGLGRLLFAQRNSPATVAVAVLIGLGLAVSSALLLPAGDEQTYLGAALLALGLAALAAAAAAAWYRVRFHRNAVVRRGLLGSRTLPYAEVEGLAYSATASYAQGVYAGTSVRLALRPRPPGKKLVVKALVHGTPEDFETARNKVASLIAARLAERLAAEGEVEWVPSVWLARDGLRLVKKRFRGGGEELAIDYRQEIGYDFQREVFRLFLPPEKKPVLKVPCRRENFYPGFLLFQQLIWETSESGLE